MKRAALLLMGAVGSASAVAPAEHPLIMDWETWRATFEAGREFEVTANEAARKAAFLENIRKIATHNAKYERGESKYQLGVNHFADLTAEEFGKVVGLDTSVMPERTEPRKEVFLDTVGTPASIDWRTKGCVTPVKNQGQCGSCWSFSSTGSLEGNVCAQTGQLISLSEKELMDCSSSEGNNSCNGGLMDYAFKFVIDNGGLDTEADYPYQPRDGTCDTTKEKNKAITITGYSDVPANNAAQMEAAVANGPVSVAIEADKEAFQLYRAGVLDSAQCGTRLDHGVLVVGYTDATDSQYPNAWIVKNSWAATWGVNGYVYISRETSTSGKGICGILEQPSYPTGGKVGPAPGPGPTPSPGSDKYENPFVVHECGENEHSLTLGTAGEICSPLCTTDGDCPGNPSGFGATPRCSIHDKLTGNEYCALECNYNEQECGASGADTSHAGANCEVYCDGSATGCQWMCLYQNQNAPNSAFDRLMKQKVAL